MNMDTSVPGDASRVAVADPYEEMRGANTTSKSRRTHWITYGRWVQHEGRQQAGGRARNHQNGRKDSCLGVDLDVDMTTPANAASALATWMGSQLTHSHRLSSIRR